MTIKSIVENGYYRVIAPDGTEIARGSKKDKRYVDILEHGEAGEYRIIQPEVTVLVGGRDGSTTTPPDLPPEWTTTPAPTWTAGEGGTYDLKQNASDPEATTLTFTLVSGTLPTGVTLDSGGVLTATSSVTEGTTTNLVFGADDGVNSVVNSPSVTITVQAASALTHSFPRTATYRISGQSGYTAAGEIAGLARYDYVVMGFYPFWSFGGYNPKTYSDAVVALNPNIKIATYTNLNECRTDSNSGVWDELKDYISAQTGPNGTNASDWWARDSAGNRTQNWPGSNAVNLMDYVVADSNGDKYPQYFAKYNWSTFFENSSFNMVFVDVFRDRPAVTADWDGDGANESRDEATMVTKYREGQVAYANSIRSVMGIDDVIINGTDWWQEPIPAQYDQVFSGCIIEGCWGYSWSIEGTNYDGSVNVWGSWTKFMASYRRFMAGSREPKLVAVNQRLNTADYDAMRYMLCSTLMDNGYYCPTPADVSPLYSASPWYDEFSYDLGDYIDAPQTSAYSNGVYVREFDNGLAVVNPRTNGQQTITLPSAGGGFHWELLNAADYDNQDPATNTGATVTQITIADADGRIIKRVAD